MKSLDKKNKTHYFKHFITITKHRFKVLSFSFKVGIPLQGLIHDLSKYSKAEFIKSAKYYDGHISPIPIQRKYEGLYSSIFNHHVHHNKHHFEHYLSVFRGDIILIKMPFKYALECTIDMISASQTYLGKNFKRDEPLKYFLRFIDTTFTHQMTNDFIKELLTIYIEEDFKGIKKKKAKIIYQRLDEKYPDTEIIKVYSLNNKLVRELLTNENIDKIYKEKTAK